MKTAALVRMCRACVAATLFVAAADSAVAEGAILVDVYSSADSTEQDEVLEVLEAALQPKEGPTIELRLRKFDDKAGPDQPTPPDLNVAIGTQAAVRLSRHQTGVPRLYGFVPKAVWEEIRACCGPVPSTDSALYLDRPASQYLRLAQAVVPEVRSIGLMFGPTSAASEPRFRSAATDLGLETATASVRAGERVGPMLRPLLDLADVLIALPDPVVFNQQTIYPILLSSYGARLPVIGYSSAMVRAGAVAAVFVSPSDAGRDLSAEIRRFVSQGRLGPPRYSRTISIAINRSVARSLGLGIASEDDLKRQVEGERQ